MSSISHHSLRISRSLWTSGDSRLDKAQASAGLVCHKSQPSRFFPWNVGGSALRRVTKVSCWRRVDVSNQKLHPLCSVLLSPVSKPWQKYKDVWQSFHGVDVNFFDKSCYEWLTRLTGEDPEGWWKKSAKSPASIFETHANSGINYCTYYEKLAAERCLPSTACQSLLKL